MAWRSGLGITQVTRSSVLTGMGRNHCPGSYQRRTGYMAIREASDRFPLRGASWVHDEFIRQRGSSAPAPPTTTATMTTTATATRTKEIADLRARRKELLEMHNGKGHILGADHWAADWGRVDDEIIRERKAIQDSVRDQILQIDARIAELQTELAKFTPAEAAGCFIPVKRTSAASVIGGLALIAGIFAAPVVIFLHPWLAVVLFAGGIAGQAVCALGDFIASKRKGERGHK